MQRSKNVIPVDDTTFQDLVSRADRPVLVDISATWCRPCEALAPVVATLADETVGRYRVVTIDIDDAPVVARQYGIRSVPTLLVFRNGEKTASHVGIASKEAILALLDGPTT
jgi:thioredoxin 1